MMQRTLRQCIDIQGIGLHSGQMVHLRCMPQPCDTGIVFRRIDRQPYKDILAHAMLIEEAFMCSNLVMEQVKVGTIEHLMSSLAGLGIDNLLLEINAAELPILDGSAATFVALLLQAGLQEQPCAKKFIRIRRPIEVRIDDKFARFEPYHGFKLDFQIDFKHPAFTAEHQSLSFDFSSQHFIQQIAQARTFGFMQELHYLQSKNLALGANLHNAIGLDEHRVLNEEGLRFPDEFVRHKILDAIGDLYLLKHQILGHFHGFKSGHALNNQLLRQIVQQPNCFEIVTFYGNVSAPLNYEINL